MGVRRKEKEGGKVRREDGGEEEGEGGGKVRREDGGEEEGEGGRESEEGRWG